MKCENCGNYMAQVKVGNLRVWRCRKCKTVIDGNGNNISSGDSFPPVKRRGPIVPILIVIVLVYFIGSQFSPKNTTETNSTSVSESQSQTEIILDVTQFSQIAPDKLIEIMGEPEETEDWDFDTGVDTYLTSTYSYDKHRYEFMFMDDKVVRLTINSPKYNDINDESFSYNDNESLFTMLGVETSRDITKIIDTGVALKYQIVCNGIDEIWFPDIDVTNKKLDTIKITYDQTYFGNLILSLDEKSDYQYKCKEVMNEILVSPSTAKYPNIYEWAIFKNNEGIVVQSYVDSQNGFGAEIRSDFQFLIKYDNIISLIINGEEMIK